MRSLMLAEFGHGYVKIALSDAKRPNKDFERALIHSQETFTAPIRNGEIVDKDETARIFADYMQKNNVRKCGVKIVLHHPKAAMRFCTFPKMRKTELDKSLKYRMPGMFPDTGDNFIYDYRTYISGTGMTNIIVIRIPTEASKDITDFLRTLGLKPVLMDSFANASSVYLERNCKGNFAAIYEHTDNVGIIGFVAGKPVSSRDIFFSDKAYAIAETQKYLRTITGLGDVFILTNLGIIDSLGLNVPENEYAALCGVL